MVARRCVHSFGHDRRDVYSAVRIETRPNRRLLPIVERIGTDVEHDAGSLIPRHPAPGGSRLAAAWARRACAESGSARARIDSARARAPSRATRRNWIPNSKFRRSGGLFQEL